MISNKVLLLEVDKRLRLSRARTLSREGYAVTSVSSIDKAIKAVHRQSYELFIVNVEAPELLNLLCAHFPPEISALIVVTKDNVKKTAECSGTGARSFLIQPFGAAEFRDTVAKTISEARLVKEVFRNKILTNMEQTNRSLASSDGVERLFKHVVEVSASGSKADYVSLAVKDEWSGKLVSKEEWGNPEPTWQKIRQQIMNISKPLVIDETVKNHARLCRAMKDAGISAVFHLPIMTKRIMIGAIHHFKVTDGVRFTPGDLNFSSMIGQWCSIILENASLHGSVQRQRLHLEKLLHEIAITRESERRRVAIDIHDGVVQWMVGASYSIKVCSTLISESKFADLECELSRIRDILLRSIKKLRHTIVNLRSLPLEEVGLITAIHRATESLIQKGIRCYTEVDQILPTLTFAEESNIYWIVQEALTNIRNHSKTGEISLHIRGRGNIISVEISDTGHGFNLDQVMNNTILLEHMGLQGMRERAELLGGFLNIDSKPGEGTSVSFSFPVASLVAKKVGV